MSLSELFIIMMKTTKRVSGGWRCGTEHDYDYNDYFTLESPPQFAAQETRPSAKQGFNLNCGLCSCTTNATWEQKHLLQPPWKLTVIPTPLQSAQEQYHHDHRLHHTDPVHYHHHKHHHAAPPAGQSRLARPVQLQLHRLSWPFAATCLKCFLDCLLLCYICL